MPNDKLVVDALVASLKQELEGDSSASLDRMDDTTAIAIEWVRQRDSAVNGRMRKKADLFLGFLKGRLRVAPPEWWSREIRRGLVSPDGVASFEPRRTIRLWQRDGGWEYSGFDNVTETKEGLLLELADQQATLKKMAFIDVGIDSKKWDPKEDGAIAGTILDGVCAVAFECPTETVVGAPRQLYCVNGATGVVLWKQELSNGLLPKGSYSGGWVGSFTEIRIDEERVMVWVGHDVAMCLEIFRRRDGKRIAKFATSYLDGIHLGRKWKEGVGERGGRGQP